MANQNNREAAIAIAAADPRSGSSLVPMLIWGLVLTVVGMIAALALS